MPNCFSLYRKGSDNVVTLAVIDEEICKAVGDEVHPTRYCRSWYDIIGLGIALGNPLGSQKLRDLLAPDSPLQPVLTYLEENYTSTAWSMR